MSTVTIPVHSARRIADPIFNREFGTERHILMVRATELPDLPRDPNARDTNVNRLVYKGVRQSIRDEETVPGTFHLKNKGITVIATSVKKRDNNTYVLHLADGHGVLDGSHTMDVILEAQNADELPEEQFVKVEVLTSVPDDWVAQISRGLNTSVQVDEESLLNLDVAFDWLKDELRDEPYFDTIAWKQNEPGEFHARELVAMLTCFDLRRFPNDSPLAGTHPVAAYEKPSTVMKWYKEEHDDTKGEAYIRMRPIARDIFTLYDTIRYEFRDLYNQGGGKKGGRLRVIETKDENARKLWSFPFIQKESRFRLTKGALFPILAAFRWMVAEDSKTGEYHWATSFDDVLKRWREIGTDLANATYEKSVETRNPDAIGKSRPHWGALFKDVAFVDLMQTRDDSAA